MQILMNVLKLLVFVKTGNVRTHVEALNANVTKDLFQLEQNKDAEVMDFA